MPLQPVKDINEYKRVKEALRDRFEVERTGDQDLFREQSKIFQPLINTQQQTEKAIKNGQDMNAAAVSNVLLPFTRELQRRNEQVDMLTEQPFYHQELPPITPVSPEFMKVDLDAGLNETDRENLQDMGFELPSLVFKNKTTEETLENIKTENRSIGQKLGKGPVGQKVEAKEKEVYRSQKKTLDIYKQIIDGLEGAKQFVSTPKKTGKGLKAGGQTKGIDVIYYPNVKELCIMLQKLNAAKQAGNNGVSNSIKSILDELLRVQAIDKDEYDNLYKNIFKNI
jgi:hypothetical protein